MHPADARDLALDLMRLHGLDGWRFRFDHARRRFGSCRPGQKLITLSRPLATMNDRTQVCDTILHEIAHALTPGAGHGPRWKEKCAELGALPLRCYTDEAVVSPPRKPALYQYGCRACSWWVERRRKTRRRYVCRRCRELLVYREKAPGRLV